MSLVLPLQGDGTSRPPETVTPYHIDRNLALDYRDCEPPIRRRDHPLAGLPNVHDTYVFSSFISSASAC